MSAVIPIDENLYELDFAAWLKQQAAYVSAGKTTLLDLANIAEELETMGRTERNGVRWKANCSVC